MSTPLNVYVACPLTCVPVEIFKEYSEHIKNLARILSEDFSFKVLYALEHSDPKLATYRKTERPDLCYKWDRSMVENSDLIIAEASFPSTGMGIELQIANEVNIPILLIYSDYWRHRESEKFYSATDGELHELQIGNGIISIMLQGLPMVKEEMYYDSPNSIRITMNSMIEVVLKEIS